MNAFFRNGARKAKFFKSANAKQFSSMFFKQKQPKNVASIPKA